MKRLHHSKRKIWIGSHEQIGLFIFDEDHQEKTDEDKVRIFNLQKQTASLFKKKIFKAGISETEINDDPEILKQIKQYEEIWTKLRTPHCFKCRRNLNELDFSICKKCGWIRCECGACGCEYSKEII